MEPLTIITKRSILDVAAALDPPLIISQKYWKENMITDNLRINVQLQKFKLENDSINKVNRMD